ncbi:MAG: copper chaperone PCu(A)C [Betaproteobacteria bacterium]
MNVQRDVRASGPRISLRSLAAIGALVATSCALAGGVTLKTAWLRPAAAGMDDAQAYVDIVSDAKLELVGASSPVAKRVELVEVNLGKDPPEAKVVASMPVPAGKTTRLAFKGSHLRLVGITKDLGNGTAVPLTLTFKSADGKEVTAAIDAQVRGLLLPQQMPAVVTKDAEPAAVTPPPAPDRPR